MNRKILVTFVAVMALAIFATPVLAAPNPEAWREVPCALVYNTQLTNYAELTDYCLNVWGLSENPYPDYPMASRPAYYIFKLQIGDDVFEGVSVNQQSGVPIGGGVFRVTAQAIWYLGDWGKTNARMNQGFKGTVILDLRDFSLGPPMTYSSFAATFTLEGFQRFNHQSLFMYVDTLTGIPPLGTVTALGNRDKN